MVRAEVDIAADGTITVTPNPVGVPDGETLYFHVRRNASDASRLTVTFPAGPDSPFGPGPGQIRCTVAAIPCLGAGSGVHWPPGVTRATVRLSAHGSPVLGRLDVEIFLARRRRTRRRTPSKRR